MTEKEYPPSIYIGLMQDGSFAVVNDEYAREYVLREHIKALVERAIDLLPSGNCEITFEGCGYRIMRPEDVDDLTDILKALGGKHD